MNKPGSAFLELKGALKWRVFGKEVLEKEYGEIISPVVVQRLKAICEFMVHIVDAKGNVPLVGDD
ncbi:MAG: hypothetical protein J7J70_07675 [Deltaproteobacteria bacterium]|nr:hypothetical protein [Candidatus Tharpellaceae bacterium]